MQTMLPFGFGALDWDDWLRGLLSALIGGGASAVTSGAVVALKDPTHYALGSKDFLELVGSVFLASGIMSAMFFLRNKPIPEKKIVTKTVEITQVDNPVVPDKKVTTVQEVHVEPLKGTGDGK